MHLLLAALTTLLLNAGGPGVDGYVSVGTPPAGPTALSPMTSGQIGFSISPDGSILVMPSGGQIGIFDGATLKLLHTIPVTERGKSFCAGERIFLAQTQRIGVYDNSGVQLWSQETALYTQMLVSPQGKHIVLLPHKAAGELRSGLDGTLIANLPDAHSHTWLGEEHIILFSKKLESWRFHRTKDGVEETPSFVKELGAQWKPVAAPGGGSYWVSNRSKEVMLQANGVSRTVATLPVDGVRKLFPTADGFAWLGSDHRGTHIGRLAMDGDVRQFYRREVVDAFVSRLALDSTGNLLHTLVPQCGVHRGFRVGRFDLTVQPQGDHWLPIGDAVLFDKKILKVGLQDYDLKKRVLKPMDPVFDLRHFSRTHAIRYDTVVDRRTLKKRKVSGISIRSFGSVPGTFEFNNHARVVDGGKYIYQVDAFNKPVKVELMTVTGRPRCSYKATQYVRAGKDGASYAIDAVNSGGEEVLIARSVGGKERWRVTGHHVRPVDVSPSGKHVAVETGILDAKTGEWLMRWQYADLHATPVFNSAGTLATVAVRVASSASEAAEGASSRPAATPSDPWLWEFFDLKKKAVVGAVSVAQGAIPADVSANRKMAVARFGSLGVLRLFDEAK